jgi:cytidyltransferase-like protein
MENAVLYTGTFDPFHLGHLWQLERNYRAHPFKKAVIAVIESNPKKPHATSWQNRIQLVKLRLQGHNLPFAVEVHPIDYVTPTALKRFTRKYLASYRVIRTIASDVMVEFAEDNEFNFKEALLLYHYAIVVRPLVDKHAVERAIAHLPINIANKFSYEIIHVQTEDDISGTSIRKDAADAYKRGYISAEQLALIEQEKLYSS